MYWTAYQYGKVWDDCYASCDQDTQETIERRLDFLCEKGNLTRPPISKHLEDGIFELRAKHARLLFYFGGNRMIVFVHAIIKKTRAVPRDDIQIAKQRRAEVVAKRMMPNALPN